MTEMRGKPDKRRMTGMRSPRILATLAILIAVLAGGCAPQPRVYAEGVLAADYKLMSKAELLRYQDRVEHELARVHAGGAGPGGVSGETYAADLRQRMKDVQHEIGLRNIWERKSYRERMEMNGPTR
jgi:hypothetical protein